MSTALTNTALTNTAASPAMLPPALAELDPAWSRLVRCPDHRGDDRTWHLLDTAAADPERAHRLTILCVHGNPSWSYLWRSVLDGAPSDVRVIAVDQLDMGFSERTGVLRRLEHRIDDLWALTEHLGITGPVVTLAHDWGGPISLGWALRYRGSDNPDRRLVGVALANTAVHQPAGSPAPAIIRLTRTPGLLRQITVNTTAFIRGAIAMSRPRLDRSVAHALLAPYRSADRRQAIADFVADIPLEPEHPSAACLDTIAADLDHLADTPALLLWGPRDPVFSDLYLHDLEARLPHADVHRFVGAGHFVPEDADVAGAVLAWLPSLTELDRPEHSIQARPPLWQAIDDRRKSDRPAVVEFVDDRVSAISFGALARRVDALAAGLVADGVTAGDRVALMIPPGIELTVTLYACWRMGAVVVLVDGGLDPQNMRRAMTSANPDHLIGIRKAIVAARVLRWPGRRIGLDDLARIEAAGAHQPAPPEPGSNADAAVVFTSGSTGPSKGVLYRHHQLQAQRDLLATLYGITDDDRLVAAFAPFALYGAALGITSAVPRGDVTKPATLTAAALAEAAATIDATMVFASPAPLANAVATADALSPAQRTALAGVRLVLSAGAAVSDAALGDAERLLPNASAHTPYGMTEVLPVADISLADRRARPAGDGACVGRPAPGVQVRISPLDASGLATGALTDAPGVLGEIVVQAAHAKQSYDRLWQTDRLADRPTGWHRTGDVGHLDADGYLWVGGRLVHLITSPTGPVAPVALEHHAESLLEVRRAAAVGVGPPGTQVVAVIVEVVDGPRRPQLAPLELADRIRDGAAPTDIAAVLVAPALPVDRRHNSKVDRTRVAAWADGVLAGGPMRSL